MKKEYEKFRVAVAICESLARSGVYGINPYGLAGDAMRIADKLMEIHPETLRKKEADKRGE